MLLKYNIEINKDQFNTEIKKLTNQIYKLLPCREEEKDWKKPLETIIQEIAGMSSLFEKSEKFFPLVCKLEGLFILEKQQDFLLYRRTIFECLGLINEMGLQIWED